MSSQELFQQFMESLSAEYQNKFNLLEKRVEQLESQSNEPINHSIDGFCEENLISKVTFHKLRKAGLPVFKIGRRTLINREAGRAWVEKKGGEI